MKTAWAHDLYSRVTNKADHLGTNVLAYAYNANGWLTNRWSKQKGNTEYRYDPVGNLTNVNYPATADLVFEYDALNRVAKDTRKGVITNTYTYHAGGQLATEATPQWASSTVTLGYTSRLRTSLTLAQPTIGNWTHAYTWDNARRLDTLTGSSGSFDYDYIAAATSGDYAPRLVKKLTVPTTSAGPNITNLWDTTGRLTETKLVNGGTTFNRHAYVLNAAHQRTNQIRRDSTYVDYTYDDAGQLNTALSYSSGGSSITTEQLRYGYDAYGAGGAVAVVVQRRDFELVAEFQEEPLGVGTLGRRGLGPVVDELGDVPRRHGAGNYRTARRLPRSEADAPGSLAQ